MSSSPIPAIFAVALAIALPHLSGHEGPDKIRSGEAIYHTFRHLPWHELRRRQGPVLDKGGLAIRKPAVRDA